MLASPEIASAIPGLGRATVKAAVTSVLAECRAGRIAPDDVVAAVLATLPPSATSLRPVLNATGVIVHTNLGRAPLSAAAVEAVRRAAGPTDVEVAARRAHDDMRTRPDTSAARRAASVIATAPPSEWPMAIAGHAPSASSPSATTSAYCARPAPGT